MSTPDEGTALWVNALCSQRRPVLLLAAAMACNELNEHRTATSILELCITLEPDNPEAHLLMGKSLVALDRVGDAAKEIERAVTLDPDCREAKSLLLWCYSGVE